MTFRAVSRNGLVVRYGARQLPPDVTELICQFTAMYIEDADRIPPELLWLSRTLGRTVLPPQYCRGYEVLVHVTELKWLIPRGPQCRPLVRGELDDEQQVRRGMKMPTGTTCVFVRLPPGKESRDFLERWQAHFERPWPYVADGSKFGRWDRLIKNRVYATQEHDEQLLKEDREWLRAKEEAEDVP
jgi:hypothetical protein